MNAANGRIAKNTLALYFRLILTLGVALYTSRIILGALGVSDFGLYGVVGGVVTLLGLFNATMSASTQRFLNFQKGSRDVGQLKRVFGTSLLIHFILAAVILALAQTAGLWLLNTKLTIDPARMGAANWAYQCSIFSFIAASLGAPFNAAIIANERMSVFAYISIIDALLKLAVAFAVQYFDADKLELYAALILVVSLVVQLIYVLYCRRSFAECRTGPIKDKALFGQMISFSGWTVTSHLSVVLRTQGVNVLLNVFFGTVVNAAQGVAMQLSNAINGFSSSFTQAMNPQIVMSYAAGDLERTRSLVMNGCRFSFFLVFLFSLPVLVETEALLKLWLRDVPDYAVGFVRLLLLQVLIESFASVMGTAQGATGRVKRYHLTISSIGLMNLPLSYATLRAGFEPYSVYWVAVVVSLAVGLGRLVFLSNSIGLSARGFASGVLSRCLVVSLLSLSIPLVLKALVPPNLTGSLVVCVVCWISALLAIATVGIRREERAYILAKVVRVFR
jgi:O-antigen/teichoic acid export membrane protein